jgi:hypothetical protein
MTDQRDPAESKDPIEPAEPTDNTDKKEPTEPTDRAEPTEPIDSTDPLDAIDKTESSDHNDQSELEPVGPEAFSNLMFPSWRRRYGYRRPRRPAPPARPARPPSPPNLVALGRPRCREGCRATSLATRSPSRHRMPGIFPPPALQPTWWQLDDLVAARAVGLHRWQPGHRPATGCQAFSLRRYPHGS